MKTCKNEKEAWEIQETYKDKPHGWIQWKGTEVCMDVTCKCGEQFHIDAGFAYAVKCPYCGTLYMCNGHIQMIECEEITHSCIETERLEERWS